MTLTLDVPNVRLLQSYPLVSLHPANVRPMYFSVVVKTSTAKAGLILSVCGGLGLALGSLLAGQYVGSIGASVSRTLNADRRHIRGGGRYRVLGIASLFPAVAASLLAIAWTPQWPWWGYYLTLFPASLGYSVFLCCQLGQWRSLARFPSYHLKQRLTRSRAYLCGG
jgi:hypothetical protein